MYFLCPKCFLNVLDGHWTGCDGDGYGDRVRWRKTLEGGLEGGRGREGKGQNNIFKYYTLAISEQVLKARGGPLWDICWVLSTNRLVSIGAKSVVNICLCNKTINITEIKSPKLVFTFFIPETGERTHYRVGLFNIFDDQA